ncbi:MAG: DUF1385 domain-containing protein [Chloroflexi bacterium]|nr:DUF1385 domain-containing protein [Chloroflexota bacterium]
MPDARSSSDRRPSRISPTTYGGQAVLEGVMMRGRRWASVAVRAPDGEIVVRSERLPVHLYGGWVSKTPFLRGLTVLWDSLGLGMKALMFSSEVAEREAPKADADGAPGDDASEQPASASLSSSADAASQPAVSTFGQTLQWTTVAVAMLFGIGVFFLLPLGVAGLLELAVDNTFVVHIFEGLVRLALLVGYVWAIGFVPDIRRVFAYHGAEHMTIHAFEAGEPLDRQHIGKYSPAHPRCGTAFLLLVVAISILLFALIPTDNWWIRIASRILAIPLIAGIAYEVLKLGGAHTEHPLMQVIVAPGLALQALTTRYPEPDMIDVAVASFETMYKLEQESDPARPGGAPSPESAPPLS